MNPQILFPLSAMLAVLTTSSMAVTVVAVLAPEAAPEIGVDATRIGVYTAIVYVFATLSGAITGPMVDRFGAIRVCQATMGLAALAMLSLSQGTLFWAGVSAVVLGCAYGPFNPASAHVLWRLSTPRWRPLVFSIKQTGVPLGGALTGALIPAIVLWSDWKTAILVVGGVALVMMVLLQRLRRGMDADASGPLRLNSGRLIAPDAGCQLSVMSFMVVFLTRTVDMSLVLAGTVFACLQAGGFAGRLIWGGIASRSGAPRAVLVTIGLITAACLAITPFMNDGWPLIAVIALAALLGATSLGWNGVLLSEVATHAPEGLAVDATAGMQVVMFGGITVFPPLFGYLVMRTDSFTGAFLAVAVLALVGAAVVARTARA
jgi:MFS family permease